MLVSTKAIVLSKLKYRDSDLIVKCYTSKLGLQSYLLRNILKSKKGKFRIAYFQELSIIEIETDQRDSRSLQYIKDLKLISPYHSIHTNLVKSSIAMFLSELLSIILKEEEENKDLFEFLETSFIWFDQTEKGASFHFLFMIELTKYIGFYPNLKNNHYNYFNLETGSFEETKSGKYCITNQNLIHFKTLLGIKFDESKKLSISNSEKQVLLDMILTYFKLHLDGFRTPKSLDVLHQVFKT